MSYTRKLVDQPPEVCLESTVPYNTGHAVRVPHSPGVYLIHDLRGVLYVGRSENLRKRYDQHYWRTNNPYLQKVLTKPVGELCFSWCEKGYPEQIAYERALIGAFQPPCNRQGYKSKEEK